MAVVSIVLVVNSDLAKEDAPDVPVREDDAPGCRDLRYLEPGNPGLVGSSRLVGLLESKTTTRCIVGRKLGSD